MIVRCWGARGSIPVSGPEYVRYGGDTTCVELRTADDEIIVLDAGSGLRRLGLRLLKEGRLDLTMIFTHSHWDHILGFPFFKPIYIPKSNIDIYSCPLKQGSMEMLLARAMAAPHFPIPLSGTMARMTFLNQCSLDETVYVKGVEVRSIPLNHPNLGLGYRFTENGRSFVFLTDNELTHPHRGGKTRQDYLEFSRGADLLFHDAEYTREEYEKLTRGWGHTVYEDALDLAMEAGVKRFGLFHHNQERSDQALDAIVEDCRRRVAEAGSDMEVFAPTQDTEIVL